MRVTTNVIIPRKTYIMICMPRKLQITKYEISIWLQTRDLIRNVLPSPTKINFEFFQVLASLDAKNPLKLRYDTSYLKAIWSLQIKTFWSNICIDIVKEVNRSITSRFEMNYKECPSDSIEINTKKERKSLITTLKIV